MRSIGFPFRLSGGDDGDLFYPASPDFFPGGEFSPYEQGGLIAADSLEFDVRGECLASDGDDFAVSDGAAVFDDQRAASESAVCHAFEGDLHWRFPLSVLTFHNHARRRRA